MRAIRPVSVVIALVLVASGAAYASTPEEKAVYRTEALALTQQTRVLEGQADTARESARLNFQFALVGADGLEDQSDSREISAYQKWLQGGAPKKAQANLLYEQARGVELEAFEFGVRAQLADLRAENARARAARFRSSAEALLASGADNETKNVASTMKQRAFAEDSTANRLTNLANSMRSQQTNATKRANNLRTQAATLEATTP